jgi:anthranilate phosphoribosyltransferase
MQDLKTLLGIVANGTPLTRDQAEDAFGIMMSGDATPAQMGGFLMALRTRGETVDEITGAARAMRAKMLTMEAPAGAIDTVGTGGDAKGTLNISSASAFVIAACGVPVAKHGNRALSSKSGAADVLTALGVNIDAPLEQVQDALTRQGICFLMAPRHHSAMRHVGPVRVELGTRTIFNLLGPLCNPARVTRQITGVFDRAWVVPVAEVLGELGSEHVWVFHGEGGYDEITSVGVTYVTEMKQGRLRSFELTPESVGLPRCRPEDLAGGDAEDNATAIRALLAGEASAFRDTVVLTSAAGLVVAGRCDGLDEGVRLAAEAIDSGAAAGKLADLVQATNRETPA